MKKTATHIGAIILTVLIMLWLDKDPVEYLTEEVLVESVDTIYQDRIVLEKIKQKVYVPQKEYITIVKTDTVVVEKMVKEPLHTIAHTSLYQDSSIAVSTTVQGKILNQELSIIKDLYKPIHDTIFQYKELVIVNKPRPYLFAGPGISFENFNHREYTFNLTYKPSNRWLITGYTGLETRGIGIQYGFLSKKD